MKEKLEDKYFLTHPNNKLEWQGQILKKVSKDTYLCQLYEWLLGNPSKQVLATTQQMTGDNWEFYNDHDYFVEQATAQRQKLREQQTQK